MHAEPGLVGDDAQLGAPERLVVRRIAAGTRNMAHGPAMSRAQAIAALEAGAALAEAAIDGGADLVGTGEMGIGNTTAASAITAAITGADADLVTGRGTGVDDEGRRRKVDVVRRALAVNRPRASDGLDVLAGVGGFEIAGLTGVMLAGAARRVPVAIDGFIAGAAALVAVTLAPAARHALFASHRSAEPGHAVVGCEGENHRSLDARHPAPQHGEARRDLLEPPEASGRLGEAVEVTLRLREGVGRRRDDRAKETGEHRLASRTPPAGPAWRRP